MCLRAPRSRGPSASKSVSLPRRASEPTSVNRSVCSITCMPTCAVTKSAIGSRSATQRATWSRVRGLTSGPEYLSEAGLPRALAGDGALQLRLVHLRASLDPATLRLVVELLLRAALRTAARAKPAAPARRDVACRAARG